jgi:uncharacterized protein (TIGR00661 family)
MKKKILVAPLNWGIGHATRCIPVIKWLIECHFEPIIASDGEALLLLEKEFPNLKSIALPALNIRYQKSGKQLKLKLLKQLPQLIKTVKVEKIITKQIVKDYNISGIISDCRFGIYSTKIPSVIITHQLQVLSGNTSAISSRINRFQLKKFKEIWVPDFKNEPSLSGQLGHLKKPSTNIKYLGALSRLNKTEATIKYDIMVLLSGPEPQRSILETILFTELEAFNGNILFVKGKIEAQQTCTKTKSFTVYNYMTSEALEDAINSSKTIICRSGYTTVMDLAKLEKSAFFIPTPGQFEQEYLAKRCNELNVVPYCNQADFKLSELDRLETYKGWSTQESLPNLEALFSLF